VGVAIDTFCKKRHRDTETPSNWFWRLSKLLAGCAIGRIVASVVAMLAWSITPLAAQPITVTTVNGAVHIKAPGFRFIDGEPLARLKDGLPVRIDLDIAVLEKPGAAPTTQHRQTFVLSYDLWEERFAVTLAADPSRSTSNLTPAAAEAWCVQQLSMSVSALGRLGRGVPFWVRLEVRVLAGADPERDEAGFTLEGLIEMLSRRRKTSELTRRLEAGPFRVQ
jgi:hypothetical protein